MINRIQLSYFRKHESLDINLSPGLTAVRGSNEAGKSTLTEGVAYALFGAKALRTSLADTVTWGHAESKLKVELSLTLEGRNYNFKRGKSGAEVTEDGQVLVTGQNEVSAFSGKLLGVDVNAAARLMMANQNGLRGSLEQGPRATSLMIEELSDFDLFDRLLDRMQEKLLLGNAGSLEAKLETAIEDLASIANPEPYNPDEFDKSITDSLAVVALLDEEIRDVFDPALRDAQRKLDSAKTLQRMHDQVSNDLRRAVDQQALHTQQKKDADVVAAKVVQDSALSTIREQITDMTKVVDRQNAYKVFKSWTAPEVFWEGDINSLNDEMSDLRARSAEIVKSISTMRHDIGVFGALKITASACGFCHKDVSQFPEVAEKNAELDKSIEQNRADIIKAEATLQELRVGEGELTAVFNSNTDAHRIINKCMAFVAVGLNVVPPTITWLGDIPKEGVQNAQDLREKLRALESEKEQIAKARARSSALIESLSDDEDQIRRLEAQLKEYPEVGEIEGLKEAVAKADVKISVAKNDAASAKAEAQRVANDKAEAQRRNQQAVDDRARLKSRVDEIKVEIETLGFNNALLKKVRAARPIIADKLWNTVLAAVAALFTEMRGEASTVTKESDGFRVNGQAVESLSGSTLDILGLAIRVALVKTFLPYCPFLILDEASASMDDSRTNAMLGFLQSCGFPQILLVTHDVAAESVADNLIYLGQS